eukprot:Lankesteria_metandrocarpae@DN4795_c0_g1_i2.p1
MSGVMRWTPNTFLFFGCVVHTFLYIDRAIIPGAYVEFTSFIEDTTHSSAPGFKFGLLQSAFITGLSLAGPPLTWLTQRKHQTHSAGTAVGDTRVNGRGVTEKFAITIGLVAWTLASFGAWLSGVKSTYYGLLAARALSGVGETAAVNVVPAILLRCLSSVHTGKALGLFYTSVPVGTAIGFAVGAKFAYNWKAVFLAECVCVCVCVAVYCKAVIGLCFIVAATTTDWRDLGSSSSSVVARGDNAEQEVCTESTTTRHSVTTAGGGVESLLADVITVLRSRVFLWLALANAGYAAVLIGLSTFGAAFYMDLNLITQQNSAATAMSVIAFTSGVVGISAGGLLLDKITPTRSKHVDSAELQIRPVLYWLSACIPFSLLSSIAFSLTAAMYSPVSFSLLMLFGLTCCFTTQAAISLSVMTTAPVHLRSLANSLMCLLMHVLGDVPSPMLIGLLRDKLAPHCNGQSSSGTMVVMPSAKCFEENFDLRAILVMIGLWLALFHTVGLLGARSAEAHQLQLEAGAATSGHKQLLRSI